MTKLESVWIDLDGTLLPIHQQEFIEAYFGELVAKLAPFGFSPQAITQAVWAGTKAMVKNDGSVYNRERFWQTFGDLLGKQAKELEPITDAFYANEFQRVQRVVKTVPDVKRLLRIFRDAGCEIHLATNPLFPTVAVESRLGWIGLSAADFNSITTYENARYCKPNPLYYADILQKTAKSPSQCLMIGNSPGEDMAPLPAGMRRFLLTDYLENETDMDISIYPHGNFDQLLAFAESTI